VLAVDEPTRALDEAGRRPVLDAVGRIAAGNGGRPLGLPFDDRRLAGARGAWGA
jgi:hypothetical protein